jgi:lipopolysaccharide/colanic/teichoic acid biosynthesis glycosyltransferase
VFAAELHHSPQPEDADKPYANDNFRQFGHPSPIWHFAAKRALDIVLSGAALLLLLPLFLGVAFAIRAESKGSILFSQRRCGRSGRIIKIYKFRSMFADQGDHTGIAQTVENDPRITQVGRFIRRYNIDELPQLINVLRGDMSLVGPRCHAVGMLAAGLPYEDLVPQYHQRHQMRPGVTGLAQARGLRGPTVSAAKARARIACDLYYVENFSIWLDLFIIAQTLKSELSNGKGF